MIFLGPKIIKGSSKKLLFYRVFQFFTLTQVKIGQIYYFREIINLPRINLKSFYCNFSNYDLPFDFSNFIHMF